MEILPFRGIRYNQSVVGDLGRVICPPYDVITSEQQELYYQKSDHNAIRLELPIESPESPTNRYQRAAITFQQWLRQGILQTDGIASFYLHEHHFEHLGEKRVRRGLIGRVKLEPWGKGIRPHEETFSKAKSDRLQLMQACRASFSPLLALYQDCEQRIAPILSEASRAKPTIDTLVSSGPVGRGREAHILWAITDPGIKQKLGTLLSSQPLYVADGHHRYETALAYQQERARSESALSARHRPRGVGRPANLLQRTRREELEGQAFNYVMMELVEFSDPGLVVLPIHRLVRGVAPSILAELEGRLREFFVIESLPLEAGRCGLPGGGCLGIVGLKPGSLLLLKRREDISLEAVVPTGRSQTYRELGVSTLNHVILENILSVARDRGIAYIADAEEACQQIKEGKYQLAFLLSPVPPRTVKAIADAHDRMPSKSTYFYPKLPAGLVINPLD
ncbi:MAG: DUF1015 domain-containing protein [Dehalococcoidia bacterium]